MTTTAVRVLMINKLRWPWIGGIERVAEQLYWGLPQQPGTSIHYLAISQTDQGQHVHDGALRQAELLPNLFHTLFGRTLCFRMPGSFRIFKAVKKAQQ